MINMSTKSVSLLLLIPLTGCMGMPSGGHNQHQAQPIRPAPVDYWPSTPVSQSPILYARSGSPVGQSPTGTAFETPEPSRDVQSPEAATRPYLLELYQRSVDEKDELMFEISKLNGELQDGEAERHGLESKHLIMQERVEALITVIERLEVEKLELAGRLTTAQIRRLESERLLLEATLEWNQLKVLDTSTIAQSGKFDSAPVKDDQ